MTYPTISAAAAELSRYFETRERGEETITVLADDAPRWAHDVVYAAHESGAMLPDDWRYATAESAAESIAESGAETRDELDGHEFADAAVDVYTGARLEWLASRLSRSDYVDQARDDGLTSGEQSTVEQIGAGQYVEALEVFEQLAGALEDRVEELEELASAELDHGSARGIASEWHTGQSSALYAFSSSGHTGDLDLVELEAERSLEDPRVLATTSGEDLARLEALRRWAELEAGELEGGEAS